MGSSSPSHIHHRLEGLQQRSRHTCKLYTNQHKFDRELKDLSWRGSEEEAPWLPDDHEIRGIIRHTAISGDIDRFSRPKLVSTTPVPGRCSEGDGPPSALSISVLLRAGRVHIDGAGPRTAGRGWGSKCGDTGDDAEDTGRCKHDVDFVNLNLLKISPENVKVRQWLGEFDLIGLSQ